MQVWKTFMRISGPVAALAVVAAAAGPVLTQAEVSAPRIVTVEMTAKRFAFLPEQVDVVEGDEVTINVRSADGTHGFEIGKLKVKQTIPRGGEVVTLTFTAPAAGRYVITCSEYCGRGHDDMKSVLVVAPRGQSTGIEP
jgi:cytochrome c oxidase subunit 2